MTPLHITHFTLSSALGAGRDAQLAALQSSRSGLRQAPFGGKPAVGWIGEVAELDRPLPAELSDWECRNNRLALLALQQDDTLSAVARLRERYGSGRIGVFIGTSTAGVHATELAYRDAGAGHALPAWFNYAHTQNCFSPADFVRRVLQLDGVAVAVATACSSSAKVFASASRAIRAGLCDAAIVGGVDSLCLTTLFGFSALQLVSSDMCRPADAQRNGISVGEAAGFVVLETKGPAGGLALLGYGESSDAHHMSSPHPQGEGAIAAMQAALRRAALDPAQIDYINLHGTATPANDAAEDCGVHAVFGDRTPCSSTKGWTGHTLGAAAIAEAVLSLLCIEQGLMPQSLNTRLRDPALRTNILMQPRRVPVRRVLSNSFGFGGSNCSLVLGSVA